MKINELVEKGLIPDDHWLTKATVGDEDIVVINGNILWKDGVWNHGIWENGIWEDGSWLNGTWFNGTWFNGIWFNGIWENGTWKTGFWFNGNWVEGYREYTQSIWPVFFHTEKSLIRIGCEEKTIKEWDEFFYNSQDVYTHKRDTQIFKNIQKNYEIVKVIRGNWLSSKDSL